MPESDEMKSLQEYVARTFLTIPDLDKMFRFFTKRYDNNDKLGAPQLQNYMREVIRQGIVNLQSIRRKGVGKLNKFPISDNLINRIMTPDYASLQYSLTQLYLSQMDDKNIIKSLTTKLNELHGLELAEGEEIIDIDQQEEDKTEEAAFAKIEENSTDSGLIELQSEDNNDQFESTAPQVSGSRLGDEMMIDFDG